jgi:hypothetical protein
MTPMGLMLWATAIMVVAVCGSLAAIAIHGAVRILKEKK